VLVTSCPQTSPWTLGQKSDTEAENRPANCQLKQFIAEHANSCKTVVSAFAKKMSKEQGDAAVMNLFHN
jgi:hypothetical protein